MKLKEYRFSKMYYGIQLPCMIVAKSAKDVMAICDLSQSYMNNYVSKVEPNTKFAIENPFILCAEFEWSGEPIYFIPKKLINVPMLFTDATKLIDNHRKICKTYGETINKYPNGKFDKR